MVKDRNNLISYARGGELLVRVIPALNSIDLVDGTGIEILSIDRGSGIENMGQSLRDGFSTGTTPGTGLGAVNRQSDVFDFYSMMLFVITDCYVMHCCPWPTI